jgi:hypothetical protein
MNPKAQASANYVVADTGQITQMVRDMDIAWHAGNWAINRESIGVEHAGYTYRKGTFTDAEYRASARLVGYELRRLVLPIDRKHVIGHSEVPDPNHPGLFGGFAHHTDPGPYWDWTRYMSYVRTYARGGAPAPNFVAAPAKPAAKPAITAKVSSSGKVSVWSSGLQDGQTVAGYVKWNANVTHADVTRVDFLVDGRLRWTEKQQPFEFGGGGGGWDTTRETNGAHVLTLRVVTKKGATAGQSLRVTVANSPFEIAAAGISNGQTLKGKVSWEAVPSGASADHVDFLVDGKLLHTEKEAPYVFAGDWDTTKLGNGAHTLALRAVAVDGRVAESSVTVLVANPAPPPPKPKPSTSISIVMKGVFGQVSGVVRWEGVVTGGRPDRVEFWVDGRWRWTQRSAPYAIDWDTTREQAGTHVLTVRAVGPNGLVYDAQTITTTVQSRLAETTAPAPTTMAVATSVADGATLHGGVDWTATVSGATPDRVEFSIDGNLRHTERSAPYEFGTWDTTKEQNGPHVLTVRAIARDGTASEVTRNVVVANVMPTVAIASQSLADGQTVSGSLTWTVVTSGATPDKVEYWIDGTLRHTERSAPYEYAWSTKDVADGAHMLVAKAFAGTQVDQRTLSVTVKNAAPASPPPAAPPALQIASQSLTDGQTVSGSLTWTVVTSGATPDKVEYWIDGTLRHTERSAPYEFAWDTTADAEGTHRLVVKAYAGSAVVERSLTVTVKNTTATTTPAQPVAIVSQTLTDGQTLTGSVAWLVIVSGPVRSVQLLIDGHRAATFRSTPYGGTLDTTKLANGAHTFVAKVSGTDSSSATVTISVTVSNP